MKYIEAQSRGRIRSALAPARASVPAVAPLSRRKMVLQRVCYVCGDRIPEAAGTYHADIRVLTHQGDCSDRASKCKRVYDRSTHGRWLSPSQARTAIRRIRSVSP